jgi:hypothetical protein
MGANFNGMMLTVWLMISEAEVENGVEAGKKLPRHFLIWQKVLSQIEANFILLINYTRVKESFWKSGHQK